MSSSVWARGALRDLDLQECIELLDSKAVGRVAFGTPEGPMILPVNYAVARDCVLFRTTPHNVIAANIGGRTAAFEVDEIDDFTQSGWSVLVRGTARFVDSVDEVPGYVRPETWAEGVRSLCIAIDLTSVTGRRLLPS